MLFKEVVSVYTEKHKKPQIQNALLLIIKPGEAYIYHQVVMG
jgi:hypothetical protein